MHARCESATRHALVSSGLHRLCLLLLVLIFTSPGIAQRGEEEGERPDSPPRTVYRLAEVVPIRAGGPAERAMRVYDDWMKSAAGGPDVALSDEVMTRMYQEAGNDATAFKTIAFVIQNGLDADLVRGDPLTHRKVQNRHSIDMAELREKWVVELVEKIGQERGWMIARSDSGNTASGMKSDMDQTFYVYERGAKDGRWQWDPELDKVFIDEFQARWARERPVTLAAVDIASIPGRSRFPDARDTRVECHWKDYERTLAELQRTPGAYRFQGAVVQQMQLRALQAIMEGNRRSFQRYGPGENGAWGELPFDPDEAVRTMFGVPPDLLPGHAFSAALANFVELQHYLHAEKFETKYHLRTWEDSALVQHLTENGVGRRGKFEYAELDAEGRAHWNEALFERLIPGTDSEAMKRRRLHALALDVSADLRLLHKNQRQDSERLREVPPGSPEADERAVFEGLAREMFGAEALDAEKITAAVQEHRRLASEFCLESILATSEEAFRLMLHPEAADHPLDPVLYRHLLGDSADEDVALTRKRLGEAAHLSFIYGIHALGEAERTRLHDRLVTRFPGDRKVLDGLFRSGRWGGLLSFCRNPGVHLSFFQAVMSTKAAELSTRVQRQVAADLGFENVHLARTVDGLIDVRAGDWKPRNLARNMAFDPGNVGALANVLRTYVESKGDMDRVLVCVADEILMAVPVGGQIVAATRGGIADAVLMAGAIQFPVVGLGLLVASVGDAGLAIHDLEYARHVATNAEDAIYRGFLGPATRSYGGEPASFTEGDTRRLEELEDRLSRARAERDRDQGLRPRDFANRAQWDDFVRQRQERYQAVAGELESEAAALRTKRTQWESFRDASWAGGYFTEGGAQKVQKPFENDLFEELEPIVSYSAAGIIDFRASFDPERDPGRLADLEARIVDETDVEKFLRMMAEHRELDLQRSRYERAQRYLDYATRGGTGGRLTGEESGIGVPELLHRLRRDSLFPALREWALRERERLTRTHGAEVAAAYQPNPDLFVDLFLQDNEAVLAELVDKKLLEPDGADPSRAIPYASSLPLTLLSRVPEDSVRRLKERMYSDYVRSMQLWKEYQRQEERRLERENLELAQRIDAYRAEAAGLVAQAGYGLEMKELLTALRLSHVGHNPPRVEATVYAVERPREPGDEARGPDLRLAGSVQLELDPRIYPRPYETECLVLDGPRALAAAAGERVAGVTLQPATRDALRQELTARGDDLPKGTFLALTRVWAGRVVDCSSAPPSTVNGLPGMEPSGTPDVARPSTSLKTAAKAAPGRDRRRVLLGESLARGRRPVSVEPEPEVIAEEPELPPLLLEQVTLQRDRFAIDEGSSSSSRRQDGLELESLVTKCSSVRAEDTCTFQLELVLPERLQPGEDFAVGARLTWSARAKRGVEPIVVRLSIDDEATQEVEIPVGQAREGTLEVGLDYVHRYVGQKVYEWNYVHRLEATHGERPKRPRESCVAMTLTICSDAPIIDSVTAEADRAERARHGGFRSGQAWIGKVRAEAKRGDQRLLFLRTTPGYSFDGGFTPSESDVIAAGEAEESEGSSADPSDGRPAWARASDSEVTGTSGGEGNGRPAWAAAGDRGTNGATRRTGDHPGAAPGRPGSPAGVLGSEAATDDPLAVLRAERPWEDTRVRAIIDEWLSVSEPLVATKPGDDRRWRWTEWGIVESPPSVVAVGPPEHGDMTRHEMLYHIAGRLVSTRHRSLREFLELRLRGLPGEEDGPPSRSALATGDVASADADERVRELEERGSGGEDRDPAASFAGEWSGPFSLMPGLEVSLELGYREDQVILYGSDGFLEGIEPPNDVLERAEERVYRSSTREWQREGGVVVDYWQTWTFRLISADRLAVEMRPSRGKPDWTSEKPVVVDARRVR